MQNCMTNIDAGFPLERPRARQQLVEQHARRKNIRARIDSFTTGLLRRSVGGRAVRNADFSQIRVMNSTGYVTLINELGQTKVENLDLPRGRDHDVAGFYISMNDAAFVRCGNRARNLNRDRERAREIEWTTVNQFADVFDFDELHGDEIHARQVREIDDGADHE